MESQTHINTHANINLENMSIKQREQLGIKCYQGNKCVNEGEQSYLDLLRKILTQGQLKEGRNGPTLSSFGERMEFNIENQLFILSQKIGPLNWPAIWLRKQLS